MIAQVTLPVNNDKKSMLNPNRHTNKTPTTRIEGHVIVEFKLHQILTSERVKKSKYQLVKVFFYNRFQQTLFNRLKIVSLFSKANLFSIIYIE
jgi:hypothetical protein